MHYTQGDPHELKNKFWKAMADSPFVMLQLDSDADSAAPMTAQLDKDADSTIWFFTRRDNRFAAMGTATATFASKGHEVFARFHGDLSEETSHDRLEQHWSNTVQAWFPEGKDDPDLLMLRMDLGEASIWSAELGMMAAARMKLGLDVRDAAKGTKVDTTL